MWDLVTLLSSFNFFYGLRRNLKYYTSETTHILIIKFLWYPNFSLVFWRKFEVYIFYLILLIYTSNIYSSNIHSKVIYSTFKPLIFITLEFNLRAFISLTFNSHLIHLYSFLNQ